MISHSKRIGDGHFEEQEFRSRRFEYDRIDQAIQSALAMRATDAVNFVPSAGTARTNSRGGDR